MIKNVDVAACPESVAQPPETPPEKTKFLVCEACKSYFPHSGRGRPPRTCKWFRAQSEKKDKKAKAAKKKARANSNLVEVPVFEPYQDSSELSVGDIVHVESTILNNEITRRRYAREYKVTRIEDGVPYIKRHAKAGHRQYEVRLDDITRVSRQVGVEYLDKTEVSDETDEGLD